jgi:hypothetical protein
MSLATRHLATALVLLIAGTRGSLCQAHAAERDEALPRPIERGAVAQGTEDDVLQRFVAVHGRRSLVDGYDAKGLEIWAGPFQLLSGYRVAFRADGTTTCGSPKFLLVYQF